MSANEANARIRRFGRRARWLTAPTVVGAAVGLVADAFYHESWGMRVVAAAFAWLLASLAGSVAWAASLRNPARTSPAQAAMDRAVRPGFLLVAAGLAGLAAVAASFAVVPPDRAAGPRWGVPLFWASLAAILVGGWVANRVLRRVWEATDVSTNREA